MCFMQENDNINLKTFSSNSLMMEWKPSKGNLIRVNFDTTFDKNSFKSTMGLVARDASGTVLLTKSMLHDWIASPFAAEVMACSHAVRLGVEMGIKELEMEGNALTVIKKCKSHGEDKSKIGAFVRDIHHNKCLFRKFYFQHAHRKAN